MRPLTLLLLLLVMGSTAHLAADAQMIGLQFNKEILLQNLFRDKKNSSDLVPSLQTAVAEAINTALSIENAAVSVFPSASDAIVAVSTWFTGENASVQSQLSAAETRFTENVPAITTSLNSLSVEHVGQQPSLVDVTDNCGYTDEDFARTSALRCPRALSLRFLFHQQIAVTTFRTAVCRTLDIDCSLVNVTAAGSTTFVVGSTVAAYYVYQTTLYTENRTETLVDLLTAVHYASVLSVYSIQYIFSEDTQIYFAGVPQALTIEGTLQTCITQVWYLIFLIVLIPLIVISIHMCFRWGLRAGKIAARDSEQEIRAGVHMQTFTNPAQMNWGALQMQQQPPQLMPQGYAAQYQNMYGMMPGAGGAMEHQQYPSQAFPQQQLQQQQQMLQGQFNFQSPSSVPSRSVSANINQRSVSRPAAAPSQAAYQQWTQQYMQPQ